MTDKSFTCRGCGCQFTGYKGYKRIYCTKQCRSKTCSYNKYRAQGRKKREEITASAACNQTHDCLACGKMFKSKRRGHIMACSRECGFKISAAIQNIKKTGGRVWVRTKRNIFAPNGQHDVGNCLQCDKKIVSPLPNRKVRKFCNVNCRDAFNWKREPFECRGCGKNVVPEYGRRQRYYCNKSCSENHNRRIGKAKRKALIRGATFSENVDPFKVFDRDGWRCQICLRKTPKSKRGTVDDRAPELDHIVPLSKGGTHSYNNTQCTCRRCNGLKSDNVYGQIPMFAT